jgi:Na+/alanine symporter
MNILIGYLFYEFKLNNYSQKNQRLTKNLRLKYRLLICPAAVFFLTFFLSTVPISLISIVYLNIIIIILFLNLFFLILSNFFLRKNKEQKI